LPRNIAPGSLPFFETSLWIEKRGFEEQTCPMGKGGSQKIGDRFTMGPREAAYAIRLLGVKHVIPMHYATF
jgi:hypothetical protein